MIKQKPLSWVDMMFGYLGLKETKGPGTTPEIKQALEELNLPWKDDETPWCASFLSAILKRCGRRIPVSPAWARSFMNNGVKLTKPAYGCIGTKARKGGGGHVTIIVGETENGKLVGLGANQSDSVNLTLFDRDDFLTFTWPPSKDGALLVPAKERYELPKYNSKTLQISTKED